MLLKKESIEEKKPQTEDLLWEVPYLLIDPKDIGRDYQAIIRINSQSGKGGVAYILNEDYGLDLPKAMHPEVGDIVNAQADEQSTELKADSIYQIFQSEYVNISTPLETLQIEQQADKTGDSVHLKQM